MPAGDGTGPMGMGPMTGRGAGFCAGFGVPGFMNPIPGWGRGMGFGRGRSGGGRGRGWRHQFYATGLPFWARTPVPGVIPPGTAPTPDYQTLKAQAEHLTKALEEVQRRIGEIEAGQAKES